MGSKISRLGTQQIGGRLRRVAMTGRATEGLPKKWRVGKDKRIKSAGSGCEFDLEQGVCPEAKRAAILSPAVSAPVKYAA